MSDITKKEQDLLDAFKKDHANKKGEMSGIEQKVYDALEKEFSDSPGQTGVDKVKQVVEKVDRDAITDIRSDKSKLKNYIRMGGLAEITNSTALKIAEQTGALDGAIKKLLHKQVDPDDVVKLAGTLGFPPTTEGAELVKTEPAKPTTTEPAKPTSNEPAADSVEGMILKYAQKDGNKVLSQAELGQLLNDKDFVAAAQKIAVTSRMTVRNESEDVKDALVLEDADTKKTITLSKIDPNLRLADDVKSGDVQMQAVGSKQPAPKGKGL